MAYVTTAEISGFLTVFIGGCFTALGWFINRLVSGIDKKLSDIVYPLIHEKIASLDQDEKYYIIENGSYSVIEKYQKDIIDKMIEMLSI